MQLILATAPWLLLVAALPVLLWRRPRLQAYPPAAAPAHGDGGLPRVSVLVPTRNDADRIGVCLATLLDSDYPDYEVLVVDHGSQDGTREIVDALRARAPQRLRLMEAGPAANAPAADGIAATGPGEGPWRAAACVRGAGAATGDLLLFTEAGTIHDSELLGRAVSALEREAADLLTVQPRLVMRGFWQRLVIPHVWLMLRARFPSAHLVNRSTTPRNAVGHHQFMLFRRAAYDAIGGHGSVDGGAVEDLALPQAVLRRGLRLFVVHGDAYLDSRLAGTFADITGDWAAAIPPAARTTVVPWAAGVAPWVVAALPLAFFVLPLASLVVGPMLGGQGELAQWGLATTGLSLFFWLVVYAFHRIRPAYAVAYPVGALATTVILARAAAR